MQFINKICSIILTVVLTMACAGAVSAQQALTLSGDSDFGGLRWEIQDGRYIFGIGSVATSYSEKYTVNYNVIKHIVTEVEAVQFLLGSRLYLNQWRETETSSGFFLEGNLLLQSLDMKYRDYVEPRNNESKDRVDTSIALLAGYKFVFSRDKQRGVTLELAAGPRFNSGDDFHDYEVKSTEGIGMFSLGYTW